MKSKAKKLMWISIIIFITLCIFMLWSQIEISIISYTMDEYFNIHGIVKDDSGNFIKEANIYFSDININYGAEKTTNFLIGQTDNNGEVSYLYHYFESSEPTLSENLMNMNIFLTGYFKLTVVKNEYKIKQIFLNKHCLPRKGRTHYINFETIIEKDSKS
ncbi:MAG: hypothetical protein A2Y62_07550 [Candidatus Fischerbacteria bacterium RBG_13_37_8]|uniref:Uncharacterized protein n=1 Tax=Candidatus Fischerbacteria bacterium RBG_13_37_8 TaxID=1817863 RepID=A0A1F5VI80_9BACT|nr:MAG: hypothetical protein A2Y62_07550 [Candidatus Fischerbacteria bacterium RBG_13_37_8]